MWFWPVNEMIELVSGKSGKNLHEYEDQSWFEDQAVSVFRFDWCKIFSYTPKNVSHIPGWMSLLFTTVRATTYVGQYGSRLL
jgi:hypothetical protein